MPQIHTYTIPIFLDPIPWDIPRPSVILDRPGMGAASVLFHAKQFPPFTLRTVCSARDDASAMLMAERFLALVTRRVLVDDGIVKVNGAVVLSVTSFLSDVGMTCGGNAVGDAWEVASTWRVLFDADMDRR